MTSKKDQIRALAEADLETFIRLVHPQRVLGAVHSELLSWWTSANTKSHQLTLLPRDHGKSAMAGYRVAWEITRNPSVRIMYVSSTSGLAVKQIKFIKDILTSDIYQYYWPEMVAKDMKDREKWTETEFSVDHPKRKKEAIRDATVFAAGLTTSITGLHCDVAVLDDVVVFENAYTQEGRDKVERQYSLLSSIEAADAREWVVGTRYHPRDLYGAMLDRNVEIYDEDGEIETEYKLFDVFQRQVESRGDGSGEFLWPRQDRGDGAWFGFDKEILARKKAQYIDKTQFRAQYYNNPNDTGAANISSDLFQYFDRTHIRSFDGRVYYKDRRLNIFAAVDFAYSLKRRADFTSIVVIGVDGDQNYYVLDIDRFKTTMISDYFSHILELYKKWGFRKLRAEVTAAQEVIVKDLKQNYVRPYGLSLSIEEYRPSRHIGTKEERIEATLQPRYNNRQIYHYVGGNCQLLEEELVLQNPSHDDIKDCLAAVIDSAVPPAPMRFQQTRQVETMSHSRFGGLGS